MRTQWPLSKVNEHKELQRKTAKEKFGSCIFAHLL